MRKAQGAYNDAKEDVKASDAFRWWKERSKTFRFVVGAGAAAIVILSVVSWIL